MAKRQIILSLITGDGTNTYVWDAENRLIQINYPGTGNNSQFTFDPNGRNVKIVEVSGGTTTSTKQFVWCGDERCEERDAAGSVTKQFFEGSGQTISSNIYFYTMDDLGSITEMANSSGAIQAQLTYDPYGKSMQVQGTLSPDFQYAAYYSHGRSGLLMTLYRTYSPIHGRFINRDPIAEAGGVNLYNYVGNDPIVGTDPTGTAMISQINLCFFFPWLCSPQKKKCKKPVPTGPANSSGPKPPGGNGTPPPGGGTPPGGGGGPAAGCGGGGWWPPGWGWPPDPQRPGRNQRENTQFRAAVREIERRIGRKLTDDEKRRLHNEITGQNYSYQEIVDIGVGMFGD